MSPLKAWLYLDRMDLSRYWPDTERIPWEDFSTRYAAGEMSLEDCAFLSARQRHAFRLALEAESYLPEVPSLDVPRPIAPDVLPLNEPDEAAPVLVTANSSLTLEILTAIWAQGTTPAYLLPVECGGNTVDMALVFGRFTPESLLTALDQSGLERGLCHRHLIIPGLTASLAADFSRVTGWEIETGPVCAAELPLFLGERWEPPR